MCDLEPFKIDLKALREGDNLLRFDLDDSYFEAIEAQEIHRGKLHVDLSVRRVASNFELDFHIEGVVHIPCDKCLDDMEQSVSADNRLVVKFGKDAVEDDELIVVPEDEGVLDVSWLIYEFIDLDIPIQHVHAPGQCNPDMAKMLAEYMDDRSRGDEETTDPRWAALRKLKE